MFYYIFYPTKHSQLHLYLNDNGNRVGKQHLNSYTWNLLHVTELCLFRHFIGAIINAAVALMLLFSSLISQQSSNNYVPKSRINPATANFFFRIYLSQSLSRFLEEQLSTNLLIPIYYFLLNNRLHIYIRYYIQYISQSIFIFFSDTLCILVHTF